jgi:nucleoside-diphosphate-sugar epimerase
MSNYLVTGSQGFLGRYLVAHLLASDASARVVGVGRSPRNDQTFTHHILLGNRSIAAPLTPPLLAASSDARYSYEPADLLQFSQLIATLQRAQPRVIFHLASALRDDPVDALFHVNVVGSVRLLEAIAAAKIGHPLVVFASSGGVYGAPSDDALPLVEEGDCRPSDLYSISKLAAESALRLIARQTQTPLVIGRVFNVVGPGQDERHVGGRIVSQLTAAGTNAQVNHVHIGALETTRDFVDARDVAAGLALLAQRGIPNEIYNVASGRETAIAEVLQLCLQASELEGRVEVRRGQSRPGDIPRHVGSREKLSRLGFEPQFSLRQSLEAILIYYRQCWENLDPAADAR